MKNKIKYFNKNGIISFNNVLDNKIKKQIKKKINNIFCYQLKKFKIIKTEKNIFANPKYLLDYQKINLTSYNNTCLKIIQRIPEIYNFGTSQKLLRIVKKLGLKEPVFSTDPLLMINSKYTNNKKGWSYSPFHQDWRSIQGSLNCLIVWIPLTQINDLTGSIEYIVSSHLNGLLKTKNHKWYKEAILKEKKIKLSNYRPKNGDAAFFSSFLLHRSEINKSNKLRISLQYRFNDLSEKTYIKRDYICNYKHAEPKKKLITNNFPKVKNLLLTEQFIWWK